MTSFIDVEHRFLAQGRCEFRVRARDRRTRFLPRVLSAAQADRNVQGAFEKPLHDQPGHAAHDGQIRNQRRELRPELRGVLVGQRRESDSVAVGTLATMAAVLSDVRAIAGNSVT